MPLQWRVLNNPTRNKWVVLILVTVILLFLILSPRLSHEPSLVETRKDAPMTDVDLYDNIDSISRTQADNSIDLDSSLEVIDNVASMASVSQVAQLPDNGTQYYIDSDAQHTDSGNTVSLDNSAKSENTSLEESALVSISNNSDPIVKKSQTPNMEERSKFQMSQVERYCYKKNKLSDLYEIPIEEYERDQFNRHMIFDDTHKSILCFVEKNGCTDMKRLFFVNNGALPLDTISWEWVDSDTYLEKALRRSGFVNKTLTDTGRKLRLHNYYKMMIVRNPLERLISGFRNKIEPPFIEPSTRFPNSIKQTILETYRAKEYQAWLDNGSPHELNVTFPEYIEYLVDMPNKEINPHFRPMIDICHPCVVRFNFYGAFKRYSQDSALIIKKIQAKPEYYRNQSLHPPEAATSVFLNTYYSQLSNQLKRRLFYDWHDELEFYYHLYPEERNAHKILLNVEEDIY